MAAENATAIPRSASATADRAGLSVARKPSTPTGRAPHTQRAPVSAAGPPAPKRSRGIHSLLRAPFGVGRRGCAPDVGGVLAAPRRSWRTVLVAGSIDRAEPR